MTTATFISEGSKVVLVIDGKRACDMPPEVAHMFSIEARKAALRCEEYMQANRIIMDQAIMQRAGVPFGLSNNRKIIEAARQEAQWNTDLRRHMPLQGIAPRAVLGTPTLRKTPNA